MSINSLFNVGSLALSAQQTAMDTDSNNIANATTVGYTRQVTDLAANTPTYTPQAAIGTGVVVSTISSNRDQALDSTYWSQSSQSNAYSTRNTLLTNISNVYGEPSSTGLAATMDQFWSSWSDLANTPDSSAAKSVVQQSGAQVASTLNQYAQGLNSLATTTTSGLNASVNTLNEDVSQIAALNQQIVAVESNGHTTAGNLRDQRDTLIDNMSTLVPVQVIQQTNGSDTVYVANTAVVEDTHASQFSLAQNGSSLGLQISGQSTPIASVGGSIGATLQVLNTDIPNQQTQLNQLAQQIVTKVNAIHQTGWTAAGDALGGSNWNSATPPTGSNVNFFNPTGTTAATIALSSQVQSNAEYIAAGDVQNGTGNNDVANELAQLGTNTSSILENGSTTQTVSFDSYYNDQITQLGLDTSDASASSTVYQTLTQQTDTQRQSENGVSTDQELIDLMQHQQAYSAAAKVVTTASDISQSLLDMIR